MRFEFKLGIGGNVAGRGTIGRVFVLLILILLLACGGILWFDYLGIIQSRSAFAPVYRLFGMNPRSGISTLPAEDGDLDADRIAKRLANRDKTRLRAFFFPNTRKKSQSSDDTSRQLKSGYIPIREYAREEVRK